MSSDQQYAPLSQAQVRVLTDKLYEKRKAAALEIEKMVREAVASNQLSTVHKILNVLGNDLCRSQNAHMRKGGLIGLAAVAIALGNMSQKYTADLVLPVLDCFEDSDSRVRYYACESLYNVIKVSREASLVHFALLFDTLSKLAADTDQNVRNGADLLDRLLKDIVTDARSFDVADLMVLVRERIHTKDTNVRKFLISWLHSMNSVPSMNLLPFLPEILDGLFQTLSDQRQMVREMCEAVIGQFLANIKERPGELDVGFMINVLIVHAQANDELVRYMSLVWLREFLMLAGSKLLPYTSGYLLAVLPCLAHTETRHLKDILEVAKSVNAELMKLLDEDAVIESMDLAPVVDVLQDHLTHEAVQTRVATLRWIQHLYRKQPEQVFSYIERLFPVLLRIISDTSDEVVLLDLNVISSICEGPCPPSISLDGLNLPDPVCTQFARLQLSPFFVKFIMSLLHGFRQDSALLRERSSFIIRQLCLLMQSERVFQSIAILLVHEKDATFAANVVQTLNGILLTATELFPLRKKLNSLDTQEACSLFECVYRCWCHQPVAVLALCLLAMKYEHAAQLIYYFSQIDVTVDLLMEIDKLVQLLESPIFSYVRLHLLDPEHQRSLSSVLYGLLMLLPQTEAFHTLHRRLQCLPLLHSNANPVAIMQQPRSPPGRTSSLSPRSPSSTHSIDMDALLAHFVSMQQTHIQHRRHKHRELLSKAA